MQYYTDMGIRYFQYLPWAGSSEIRLSMETSFWYLKAMIVFSALRVYALGQRNWLLSALTFFWSVLAFPLDYYVSDDIRLPSIMG